MTTKPPTLTCPVCNRTTRPPESRAADYPGVLGSVNTAGMCARDYRIANGYSPPNRRKNTTLSLQTTRKEAATIAKARAARGVPAEGLTHIRIVNTRGRILHVPQAA